MESRMGADFSKVRIHADARAAESAQEVGALAYTVGSHIAFAPGQYATQGREGERLLAHELAHVVQQRDGSDFTPTTVTDRFDPAEVEADRVADAVAGGQSIAPGRIGGALSSQSVSLQLSPKAIYCALHAAVCLGLSENPPAAALCWSNFAIRCAGPEAAAAKEHANEAVAAAPEAASPTDTGGAPEVST